MIAGDSGIFARQPQWRQVNFGSGPAPRAIPSGATIPGVPAATATWTPVPGPTGVVIPRPPKSDSNKGFSIHPRGEAVTTGTPPNGPADRAVASYVQMSPTQPAAVPAATGGNPSPRVAAASPSRLGSVTNRTQLLHTCRAHHHNNNHNHKCNHSHKVTPTNPQQPLVNTRLCTKLHMLEQQVQELTEQLDRTNGEWRAQLEEQQWRFVSVIWQLQRECVEAMEQRDRAVLRRDEAVGWAAYVAEVQCLLLRVEADRALEGNREITNRLKGAELEAKQALMRMQTSQEKLEALERAVEEAERGVREREEELWRAKEDLSVMTEREQNSTSSLAREKAKAERSGQLLSQKMDDIERTMKALGQIEEQFKNERQKVNDSDQLLAGARRRLDEVDKTLGEERTRSLQWVAEKENLLERLRLAEAARDDAEGKIKDLAEALKKAEGSNQERLMRIEWLEGQLAKWEARDVEREKSLQGERLTQNQLQAQLAEKGNEIAQLRKDVEMLEWKYKQAVDTNMERTKQVEDLEAQIKRMQGEHDHVLKLEGEHEQLRLNLKQAEERCNWLQEELKVWQDRERRQGGDLQSEMRKVEQLEQQLKKQGEQLAVSQKEFVVLESKLREEYQKVADLQQRLNTQGDLEGRVRDLQHRTDQGDMVVQQKREQLELAERRNGELERQLQAEQQRVSRLETQMATTRGQDATTQQRMFDLEAQLRNLQGQLKDANAETDRVRERANQSEARAVGLEGRVADLQRQLNERPNQGQLAAVQSQLEIERQRNADLQRDVDHYKSMLEGKDNQAGVALRAMEGTVQQLRDSLAQKDHEISGLQAQLAAMQRDLASMQGNEAHGAEQARQQAEAVNRLENQLRDAYGQYQDLSGVMGDVVNSWRGATPIQEAHKRDAPLLNHNPDGHMLLDWANRLLQGHPSTKHKPITTEDFGGPTGDNEGCSLDWYLVCFQQLMGKSAVPDEVLGVGRGVQAPAVYQLMRRLGLPEWISQEELETGSNAVQHTLYATLLFQLWCDTTWSPVMDIPEGCKNAVWDPVFQSRNIDPDAPMVGPDVWRQRLHEVLNQHWEWRRLGLRSGWHATQDSIEKLRALQCVNCGKNMAKVEIDTVEEALETADERKANGEYDRALHFYERALEMDGTNIDALHKMAFLKHHYLNDMEGALKDYSRVLALDPNYADAYRNRADLLHYQMGRYKEALQDYNTAIDMGNHEADTYNNRGECLLKLLNLEGAFKDFELCLKKNPAHIRGKSNMAETRPKVVAEQKKKAHARIKDALATLPTIEFDRNKYNLTGDDVESLNEVSRIMLEYALIRLRVIGITVNQKLIPLADKRAQACIEYIVNKGVSADRMEPKGIFGDKMATEFEPID